MSNNIQMQPRHQHEPSPAGQGSARWDWWSHMRLWPVAAATLTLDLWSKHWAFTHLDNAPMSPGLLVIPHIMSFRRSLNAGALFGLGKGLTPVFIAASFVALLFVFFLFIHSGRDRRSLHLALGLVLAGALGNLYDRAFVIADVVRYTVDGHTRMEACKVIASNENSVVIGTWPDGGPPHQPILRRYEPRIHQQGVVRDFIKMEPHFTVGGLALDVWPWVFNVADMLLVVGVGILMVQWIVQAYRQARTKRNSQQAADNQCE
jgi:lipoprotein signal peptidase